MYNFPSDSEWEWDALGEHTLNTGMYILQSSRKSFGIILNTHFNIKETFILIDGVFRSDLKIYQIYGTNYGV